MQRSGFASDHADAAVLTWNAQHPIGTKVRYHLVIGQDSDTLETETRSEAWALGGHSAVVQVKGKSGCVALAALDVL